MSASQVDKLGERLKTGPITADDLRLLDSYRRTFQPAMNEVMEVLRRHHQLEPTAREAKSTRAIIAKIRRQGTRLSRMQDIAGCRVIKPSLLLQRAEVHSLLDSFPGAKLDDRVARPSHGYRALHLIVKAQGHWVEIQVRTELQHLWAQVCEQCADRFGLELKFGGGPARLRLQLQEISDDVEFADRCVDEPTLFRERFPASVIFERAEAAIAEHRRILRERLIALTSWLAAEGNTR